jgi:hemerythrin superfamily protein
VIAQGRRRIVGNNDHEGTHRMATAKKSSARKTTSKTASKTSSKSASRTSSRSSERPGGGSGANAIALLKADHREVKKLFEQYEELADRDAGDEEKRALAEQICNMLTVHAQIEEEIFYPAARESIEETDLVDEATVEHASAKDLIAQIQDMDPSEELYDAKVTVLGEYIDHHVKEEERQMFPQARKADLDLEEMGMQLQQRKQELMAELGMETGEEE